MRTEQEIKQRLEWLKSEINKEQNRGAEKLIDLLAQLKFAEWVLDEDK